MERFEYVASLGEGAYGQVWLCKNRENNTMVAMKRFKEAHTDPEVMRLALREIRLLKASQHPNVVALMEAFRSKSGRVYVVMEHVERTLTQDLRKFSRGMPPRMAKFLTWQLLHVTAFLHGNKVMHRDLKPANILLTSDNILKLCDFGFARALRPTITSSYTLYTTTRWYRAPEVLLNDDYGPKIDVWAIGCLFSELVTGRPLFPGKTSADQLWLTLRTLGPLGPHQAQLLGQEPLYASVQVPPAHQRHTLEQRFPRFTPDMMQLLRSCLALDPDARCSAEQALTSPYFDEVPAIQEAMRVAAAAGQSYWSAVEREWAIEQERAQLLGLAGITAAKASATAVSSAGGRAAAAPQLVIPPATVTVVPLLPKPAPAPAQSHSAAGAPTTTAAAAAATVDAGSMPPCLAVRAASVHHMALHTGMAAATSLPAPAGSQPGLSHGSPVPAAAPSHTAVLAGLTSALLPADAGSSGPGHRQTAYPNSSDASVTVTAPLPQNGSGAHVIHWPPQDPPTSGTSLGPAPSHSGAQWSDAAFPTSSSSVLLSAPRAPLPQHGPVGSLGARRHSLASVDSGCSIDVRGTHASSHLFMTQPGLGATSRAVASMHGLAVMSGDSFASHATQVAGGGPHPHEGGGLAGAGPSGQSGAGSSGNYLAGTLEWRGPAHSSPHTSNTLQLLQAQMLSHQQRQQAQATQPWQARLHNSPHRHSGELTSSGASANSPAAAPLAHSAPGDDPASSRHMLQASLTEKRGAPQPPLPDPSGSSMTSPPWAAHGLLHPAGIQSGPLPGVGSPASGTSLPLQLLQIGSRRPSVGLMPGASPGAGLQGGHTPQSNGPLQRSRLSSTLGMQAAASSVSDEAHTGAAHAWRTAPPDASAGAVQWDALRLAGLDGRPLSGELAGRAGTSGSPAQASPWAQAGAAAQARLPQLHQPSGQHVPQAGMVTAGQDSEGLQVGPLSTGSLSTTMTHAASPSQLVLPQLGSPPSLQAPALRDGPGATGQQQEAMAGRPALAADGRDMRYLTGPHRAPLSNNPLDVIPETGLAAPLGPDLGGPRHEWVYTVGPGSDQWPAVATDMLLPPLGQLTGQLTGQRGAPPVSVEAVGVRATSMAQLRLDTSEALPGMSAIRLAGGSLDSHQHPKPGTGDSAGEAGSDASLPSGPSFKKKGSFLSQLSSKLGALFTPSGSRGRLSGQHYPPAPGSHSSAQGRARPSLRMSWDAGSTSGAPSLADAGGGEGGEGPAGVSGHRLGVRAGVGAGQTGGEKLQRVDSSESFKAGAQRYL